MSALPLTFHRIPTVKCNPDYQIETAVLYKQAETVNSFSVGSVHFLSQAKTTVSCTEPHALISLWLKGFIANYDTIARSPLPFRDSAAAKYPGSRNPSGPFLIRPVWLRCLIPHHVWMLR